MSLNAIAKGAIVDWCVDQTFADRLVERVVVNAGGDLVHRGTKPANVGIEDPATKFDNVPPLTYITLDNAALATSGSQRRGFTVAGTRSGHVVDPRTGWPVDHIRSASVVAPTAALADALATAFMVLKPPESFTVAEAVGGIAALIVDSDGAQHRNAAWSAIEQ
ncbi:MAG: FAD:protein FMN transferase [Acidimicrobiales bacterium]